MPSNTESSSGAGSADAGQPVKICRYCQKDCAGKPRLKDEQGRYACKSCHEAALAARGPANTARPPAAALAPAAVADTDDDPFADLRTLGEEPIAVAGASAGGGGGGGGDGGIGGRGGAGLMRGCVGCGAPLAADAVICVGCGTNQASGKARKTRTGTDGGGVSAEKAVAVLWTANPLAWALGGLVGGGIGAAIWGAVAYHFKVEIGWLAVLVGFLSGAGVFAMARQHAGVLSGVVAAVIAVASMAGGRYAAVSMMVDDVLREEPLGQTEFTPNEIMVNWADEIVAEREAQGQTLKFDNGVATAADAYNIADYPDDIERTVQARWAALSATQQASELARAKADFDASADDMVAMIKEDGFLAELGPIDILFAIFGIVAAFGAGSGSNWED